MRYDGHFRLAHELGKHLHEVLGWNGPLTHRQFVLWNLWLDEQLNIPTRDNYYQMQVACETRRMFSKNPQGIKIDHFKLKFKREKEQTVTTDQERIRQIHQRWIGRMTAPVRVIQDGQEIEPIIPPIVKRQQEQKKQQQKQRETLAKRQQQKQTQKKPPEQTPSSPNNGDNARTRRIASQNDRRRK